LLIVLGGRLGNRVSARKKWRARWDSNENSLGIPLLFSIDLHRVPTMGYRGKEPNCEVALELDVKRFFELLYQTIAAYR
jgi:hypothetical protein